MNMREVFEKAVAADPYDETTHRAYADWLSEQGHDAYAEHHRLWTREWQEASDWLWAFAKNASDGSPLAATFAEIIAAGHTFLEKGETSMVGGSLGFGASNQFTTDEEAREFWKHWSAYTRTDMGGREPPDPFHCCY